MVSEKSKNESASDSKTSFCAYGVTASSVFNTLSSLDAPLSEPTIFSPTTNVPLTTLISSTLVEASQLLTMAVVLLADPVTVSLNIKFPELPTLGEPMVIVGATVYPTPASVMRIDVTMPAELISAVADAVVPIPGPAMVTSGATLYPLPPSETVMIPIVPSAISVVAATPAPPPPTKDIPGATVYPNPGLIIQHLELYHLLCFHNNQPNQISSLQYQPLFDQCSEQKIWRLLEVR